MPTDSNRSSPRPTLPVLAIRYGLPLALLVTGAVLIVVGHARANSPIAATGLVLGGLALSVWMLNMMYRWTIESNQDRAKEEAARDYYSEHGHWPGEGES
jgi:hypothetical protein